MGAPEEAMETPAEEPMEEVPMETRAPVQFTLMLEEMNASGVTGTASAETQAQSVTVGIELAGAPAGEELPAHIHQGTCASGGPMVAPLSSIQVSDEGDASGTTTLDIGQIPEGESTFVQVHAPDGQPVACADIPTPTGM